jgi:hypothetical protein
MNAVTPIRACSKELDAITDVNLTAIFEREGIKKVERLSCFYAVLLMDGRIGVAQSVGDALAKAKAPGACNVNRKRVA